jgi:hypothetical protein
LVALLFVIHPGQANAAPQYGYRFTLTHGYIVWVTNDRYFPIQSTCHWWAGGNRWHFSHLIPAGAYRWTTSDAGSWGDNRPRNLSCSYVRAF